MRNIAAAVLAGLVAFLVIGCWNAKARVDELLHYKIEDYREKNGGKEPTNEEIVVMQKEAEDQERKESKERRETALAEGAEGVGQLASGNLVGGGLLLAGAVLTYLGLRGGAKGKPTGA